MLSRRSMLMALPAAFGWRATRGILRACIANGARRIAVVFPSSRQPCAEAVDGLRERLSGGEIVLDLLDANKATFAADATAELVRKPAVVVAVGSDAVRQASALESTFKFVSTMTLEADSAGGWSQASRVAAAVYLDIPIHTQISELRKIFPERTRVGVIRNPAGRRPCRRCARWSRSGHTRDRRLCHGRRVVAGFSPLPQKGRFCALPARQFPVQQRHGAAADHGVAREPVADRELPAFVRAGAAVGIYPD